MKRYRGENSLYDDIAARFDKHLAEPERPKYKRWVRVSLATWKAWQAWRRFVMCNKPLFEAG